MTPQELQEIRVKNAARFEANMKPRAERYLKHRNERVARWDRNNDESVPPPAHIKTMKDEIAEWSEQKAQEKARPSAEVSSQFVSDTGK